MIAVIFFIINMDWMIKFVACVELQSILISYYLSRRSGCIWENLDQGASREYGTGNGTI